MTDVNSVCFNRECNPDYWSELPKIPNDFLARKNQYQLNVIPDDPSIFTDAYWKQPEWVTRTGPEMNEFYNMLDVVSTQNREVIWCVGIYDAQKMLTISKDDLDSDTPRINPEMQMLMDKGLLTVDEVGFHLKGRVWVRACPGATRHFGVSIQSIYPSSGVMQGTVGISGGTINSSVENAEQYLGISSSVEEFTLGIYFPKIEYDYNKEVPFELTIKKGIPLGWYIVGLEAGAPTRAYQVNQSEKYEFRYTDPNIGMSSTPKQFKVFINVV